jgi:hypothetical protein
MIENVIPARDYKISHQNFPFNIVVGLDIIMRENLLFVFH